MELMVCNAGSTSLKFKLYRFPDEAVLARGRVERVGRAQGAIYHFDGYGRTVRDEDACVPDYRTGVTRFLDDLRQAGGPAMPDAVAFKTVLALGHPGVCRLNDDVLAAMEKSMAVAPAHNRAYLDAIAVFRDLMPSKPLIGVFETAFHTTIPLKNALYSVPWDWYQTYGVRKMGYHGASHSYIASRLKDCRRVISCHLGGSSSICAILDGQSVDTSFGLSLQTGVFANNRCGDLDPYVIFYMEKMGLSSAEIEKALRTQSGLLGISGVSGDLREVQTAMARGDERARLAIEMYATSVGRYVGAYALELGGVDALAFTGGIGERSALIREMVCRMAAPLGIAIDPEANEEARFDIAAPGSTARVCVIPADEEIVVARRAFELLTDRPEAGNGAE